MLLPILLSVLWAICSTALIHPWLWKRLIKRESLIGDEEDTGVLDDVKNAVKFFVTEQVVFGVVTFVISIAFYVSDVRYDFYGSIAPILVALLFQYVNNRLFICGKNQKVKLRMIVVVAAICVFLSITDAITSSFDIIGVQDSSQKTVMRVYKQGGDTIAGVVVFDEDDDKVGKFISCNSQLGISSEMRQEYPFSRIKALDIVVSDNDVPFGKYAILSKPNMFGAPVLDKYILQNMLTGEFTEYTAELLPEFAK